MAQEIEMRKAKKSRKTLRVVFGMNLKDLARIHELPVDNIFELVLTNKNLERLIKDDSTPIKNADVFKELAELLEVKYNIVKGKT